MKNFKEIAEKCLAGELSGAFIFNNGAKLHSQYLKKSGSKNYFYLREFFIDKEGQVVSKGVEGREIINFIPNNMQKQIKIDIPEGKVPVMEQTEKGVVITWKEKELTYDDIVEILQKDVHNNYIENLLSVGGFVATICSDSSDTNIFYKKVEVLRKLTNIRNYFGKPDNMLEGWCITHSNHYNTFGVNYINDADMWFRGVIFKEGEHVEQAIKMLGDELKYLFEPW